MRVNTVSYLASMLIFIFYRQIKHHRQQQKKVYKNLTHIQKQQGNKTGNVNKEKLERCTSAFTLMADSQGFQQHQLEGFDLAALRRFV